MRTPLKTTIAIACLSSLVCVGASPIQEPTPTPPISVVDKFDVASVRKISAFAVGSDIKTIQANGSSYLVFDSTPKRVELLELEVVGNAVDWIEVYRFDDRRLPVTIDGSTDPKTGKVLYYFESWGPGLYRVRSATPDGKSVWSEFTIEGQPDDPKDPPVDPPTNDPFRELVRSSIPGDPTTAKALAAGYRVAIERSKPDSVTLDQARQIVSAERAKAMLGLPFFDNAKWNDFLAKVVTQLTTSEKSEYLRRITVLAEELEVAASRTTNLLTPAIRSTVNQSLTVPVVQPTFQPLAPQQILWAPQTILSPCPGGVCPPAQRTQSRFLFRR